MAEVLPPAGHSLGRGGDARVAGGARELALQGRERFDELGRLEVAVAPALILSNAWSRLCSGSGGAVAEDDRAGGAVSKTVPLRLTMETR